MTVRDPDRQATSCTEVREFRAVTLHRYQVPELIEFVDALPKTATGKDRAVQAADRLREEISSRDQLEVDVMSAGLQPVEPSREASAAPNHEALIEESCPRRRRWFVPPTG